MDRKPVRMTEQRKAIVEALIRIGGVVVDDPRGASARILDDAIGRNRFYHRRTDSSHDSLAPLLATMEREGVLRRTLDSSQRRMLKIELTPVEQWPENFRKIATDIRIDYAHLTDEGESPPPTPEVVPAPAMMESHGPGNRWGPEPGANGPPTIEPEPQWSPTDVANRLLELVVARINEPKEDSDRLEKAERLLEEARQRVATLLEDNQRLDRKYHAVEDEYRVIKEMNITLRKEIQTLRDQLEAVTKAAAEASKHTESDVNRQVLEKLMRPGYRLGN